MTKQPRPRKYRIERSTIERFVDSNTVSERSRTDMVFATDEYDALIQAGQVEFPPADTPINYQVTELPFWFICEVKPIVNVRWWETEAIRAADLVCIDHGDNQTLEDMASSIEDGWSEWIGRDGEPGPRPSIVNFDVKGTKLLVRSTRILAIVTRVEPKGGDRD